MGLVIMLTFILYVCVYSVCVVCVEIMPEGCPGANLKRPAHMPRIAHTHTKYTHSATIDNRGQRQKGEKNKKDGGKGKRKSMRHQSPKDPPIHYLATVSKYHRYTLDFLQKHQLPYHHLLMRHNQIFKNINRLCSSFKSQLIKVRP